ncbi:MAG: TonB-dependent receptor plug domain-containing protein [Deltaproteobacteria bacterium]|nr:TonB-dependent receptor plug domain-containing protein [Deltaproteobacteria bacterium]
MRSSEKFLVGIAVLFACTLFAFSSFAEEGESTVALEEVVVTASRDKEEVRKIPANVSVITAGDIKKSGATSIVEVLEKLGSINFKTFSGNPSQAVVDMRVSERTVLAEPLFCWMAED